MTQDSASPATTAKTQSTARASSTIEAAEMHLSTVHRSRYYGTTLDRRDPSEPARNSHMSSVGVTLVIICVLAIVLFGTWFVMKRRQRCKAKQTGQGSHFDRSKTHKWRDPGSSSATSSTTRSQSAGWDTAAVTRPAGAYSPVESPYRQPGYWYDGRTDRNHPALSQDGFEPVPLAGRR